MPVVAMTVRTHTTGRVKLERWTMRTGRSFEPIRAELMAEHGLPADADPIGRRQWLLERDGT